MLLLKEYRFDLREHLENEPEETFKPCGRTKDQVMSDAQFMERAWILYQKAVMDYEIQPYQAFRDTLAELLQIPAPDNTNDEV